MHKLSDWELKCFLAAQAICLGVVASFLMLHGLMAAAAGSLLLPWIFYLLVLAVVVGTWLIQRCVRHNMRDCLLGIAGIYGVLSLVMLPMLFVS